MQYQFAIAWRWDLSSTTQPYKPNIYNENSADAPTFNIWEFPNNGGDSWAYSDAQMIQRFNDNYNGKALSSKKMMNYISHPHWFNVDKPKLENLFSYINENTNRDDKGPVIYVTLDQAYKIWELNK